MSQRDMNLLWLRDTLDHLHECHDRLQWAGDDRSVHVIAETMLRDLERCRRLCEALQRRSPVPTGL